MELVWEESEYLAWTGFKVSSKGWVSCNLGGSSWSGWGSIAAVPCALPCDPFCHSKCRATGCNKRATAEVGVCTKLSDALGAHTYPLSKPCTLHHIASHCTDCLRIWTPVWWIWHLGSVHKHFHTVLSYVKLLCVSAVSGLPAFWKACHWQKDWLCLLVQVHHLYCLASFCFCQYSILGHFNLSGHADEGVMPLRFSQLLGFPLSSCCTERTWCAVTGWSLGREAAAQGCFEFGPSTAPLYGRRMSFPFPLFR